LILCRRDAHGPKYKGSVGNRWDGCLAVGTAVVGGVEKPRECGYHEPRTKQRGRFESGTPADRKPFNPRNPMNADRHALNAALEYSEKQAQEIQRLMRSNMELRNENRSLRRQVEDVRATVGPRDRSPAYGEQSMPQGMTPIPPQPATVGHTDEF
jgi:hypothetical protein